ncbi:MAG TPA: M20/M25/M40 family metallo-hydrolase [Candidatus Methanofastidiosa archaeon]|nr:M20/M25/M40 family metallo-hydrolase [Candidatus Methanofastidiosa archaeon]HPR41139.1 M20/M25/M40 family metallo-hydrolase [Candidatus Methanofastidiosa archaeon]
MSLGELSCLRGISGQEKEVRSYIIREIEGHCEDIRTDSIGNLYAKSGGDSKSRIGLFAHMDEVGMMVTRIDGHLLHFDPVGGINPVLLPGTKVRIGENATPGVVGCPPKHLQKKGEGELSIPLEDLRIDVGDFVEEIEIGDMVTFDTEYRERSGVAKGKAFDDRIGCQCLIDIIKKGVDADCTFVFTVQEEAGLRGAQVASQNVDIDYGMACEGTFALDQPGVPDYDKMPMMGHGPVITIADRSVISSREMVDAMASVAGTFGIPYQFKRPFAGGTDAGMVHLSGFGVPSCVVSNPCRYIHSPCAMARLEDLNMMSKLIYESIGRISEGI